MEISIISYLHGSNSLQRVMILDLFILYCQSRQHLRRGDKICDNYLILRPVQETRKAVRYLSWLVHRLLVFIDTSVVWSSRDWSWSMPRHWPPFIFARPVSTFVVELELLSKAVMVIDCCRSLCLQVRVRKCFNSAYLAKLFGIWHLGFDHWYQNFFLYLCCIVIRFLLITSTSFEAPQ